MHFQKISFTCWRKRKSTKESKKKNKWIFQYEGFFLFEKVEKTRNGRCERRQKERKRIHKTI